jgi:uncharacterized membrane protein
MGAGKPFLCQLFSIVTFLNFLDYILKIHVFSPHQLIGYHAIHFLSFDFQYVNGISSDESAVIGEGNLHNANGGHLIPTL